MRFNIPWWRFLYTGILALCLPLLSKRLIRECPPGEARTYLKERLGYLPKTPPQAPAPLWIHCASMGEVITAEPVIRALLQAPEYQQLPLLITCMTATGATQIRQRFQDQARVTQAFLPLDFPVCVKTSLQRVRPRLVIILETELWPNWLAATDQSACPVLLLNGRLSAKSLRRYLQLQRLFMPALAQIDAFSLKSVADQCAFQQLGVPLAKTQVSPNLKLLSQVPKAVHQSLPDWQAHLGQRPIWVAASTHSGEEAQILQTHRLVLETYPQALLILVPRHPQRFAQVAQQLIEEAWCFCQRSQAAWPNMQHQVWLGDSLGELLLYYGVADAAFIGGTWHPSVGGHNPLEALIMQTPTFWGPHHQQQADLAELLTAHQLITQVDSPEQLAQALIACWQQPAETFQNMQEILKSQQTLALKLPLNLIKSYLNKQQIA